MLVLLAIRCLLLILFHQEQKMIWAQQPRKLGQEQQKTIEVSQTALHRCQPCINLDLAQLRLKYVSDVSSSTPIFLQFMTTIQEFQGP